MLCLLSWAETWCLTATRCAEGTKSYSCSFGACMRMTCICALAVLGARLARISRERPATVGPNLLSATYLNVIDAQQPRWEEARPYAPSDK
jgi:hypothetical protein